MTYVSYGLLLQCDFSLTHVPEYSLNKKPDVIVRSNKKVQKLKAKLIHEQRYQNGKLYAQFCEIKDGFLVRLPSYGSFNINKSGIVILCQFKPDLTDEEKTIGLIHHVLPLAVSLRGEVVLHSAAIVINNEGHLVVAGPGVGKSTFAHFMYKSGYTVYSDDAARMLIDNKSIKIVPSSPYIRVWQAGKKRHLKTHYAAKKQVKVKCIYLLQMKSERLSRRSRLSAIQSLPYLLPQIFRLNLNSINLKSTEISNLTCLVRSVPVFLIPHEHSPSALKKLRKFLVNQAEQ